MLGEILMTRPSVLTTSIAEVAESTPSSLRTDTPVVSPDIVWTALRLFNMYRLVIAGLLAVLSVTSRLPQVFVQVDQHLLTWSAGAYFFIAISLQILIEQRTLSLYTMRNVQVLIDIAALVLFMHASGGAAGGFGILLLVAIAGACLVASWRSAVAFAALATLAVLVETLLGSLYSGYATVSYTSAGLLGAAIFATAILASTLSEKIRRSEALALEQAAELEQLSRLNEHIVQRMRSGIVVLDADLSVVMLNESARRLLGVTGETLALLDQPLRHAYDDWRRLGENRKTPLRLKDSQEVLVSFTQLGHGAAGDTLAFVEDSAETQQRAQQIKLASLGRLTASIAHEIRNPLSAISHAAQLLAESSALGQGDARLAQIVVEHARRVNEIVKNVMMIGRREIAVSESFALREWFDKFQAELCERHDLQPSSILCEWLALDLVVRMDQSQLHQVLWNLCENGLRYSVKAPRLRFVFGVQRPTGRAFIDIIDTGPGMTDDVAAQIFEPFFTAEPTGTGLGLYIARELCEGNQAALTLHSHDDTGCRFRILFAHPHRQQLSA